MIRLGDRTTQGTDQVVKTDAEGRAEARGFHGRYTVTVTPPRGAPVQSSTTLKPNGQHLTVTLP